MSPACRAADVSAAGVEKPQKVDITQPGTYRSGLWTYRLVVTSPGSRSEGTKGDLLYGGRPLPAPAKGDYYRTPWGEIQWVGTPGVQWGEHGWAQRSPLVEGGKALPDPSLRSGAPVVMARVYVAAEKPADLPAAEAWVSAELGRLGKKGFEARGAWFAINDQAVVIHDTKRSGTLTARLLPARAQDRLSLLFDGRTSEIINLPRKDGQTTLVTRELGSIDEKLEFFIAIRVEQAQATWPKPVEIGAESDGKEVTVKGFGEIIISLPGDKRSGLVWTVAKVQGDAPLNSSVVAVGTPQFTPAMGADAGVEQKGMYENTFHAVAPGKTWIELALRRPWQTDKPAERTFKVALDVKEVPAGTQARP